jgi:ABC-2 type transport system ATP-binding protein
MSAAAVETIDLRKTYPNVEALRGVSLRIEAGEIFALLGPNGAGKTTWISIVCGLVRPTGGRALVLGHDVVRDSLTARKHVGLVPQEVNFDPFFTPREVLRFQMGYYGLPPDEARIEEVLRALDLYGKADTNTRALSGGMKRRLLIAKALSHEPQILFLDEPTAGVDVELRRDMWALVRRLRESGVTVILTTHYIEEAEEMADRIGVVNKGELIVVEEKAALMRKLGRKQLTLHLLEPLAALPPGLAGWPLALNAGGSELEYSFEAGEEHARVPSLLQRMSELGIGFKDLQTRQSSLEDIFIGLVHQR